MKKRINNLFLLKIFKGLLTLYGKKFTIGKPEDMKSLKLRLVQQIMATNDPEVLETIRQILETEEMSPPTSSPELPKTDPLAHALGLGRTENNLDSDADDLQQSIDDIFNPKA